MEYQKIINLLDDTTNQPSKFRTRNWVDINNESRGDYNDDNDDDDNNNTGDNNNNIKCKSSMIGQIYVILVTHTYLLKEL